MKKVSTAAVKRMRNFSQHKLTIGLDLGDRSSCYCGLDEAGGHRDGTKTLHHSEGPAIGIRSYATQPHRAGDRDAFPLGQPIAERVGT